MDRQHTISSSSSYFSITPENVVPVARRLIALNRSVFKRNMYSRRTSILRALQKTLYTYQSNRAFRRSDRIQITQLEQELSQLIAITQGAVTLLKPFSRAKLLRSFLTKDSCMKQATAPISNKYKK